MGSTPTASTMSFFMRKIVAVLTFAGLLLAAAPPAAGQTAGVTFTFRGVSTSVPRFGTRIEAMPVLRLIGADAGYSPAAGTYVIELGEHQVQISPGSRFVLVDGELEKTTEAPVSSPAGIAASADFIDRVLLSPFGYHLESSGGGYRIEAGARVAPVVTVRAAAADFAGTTTLVLTLSRPVKATVKAAEGGTVAVRFADARPQVDRSFPLRSRRVIGLEPNGQVLRITLARGVGLLSSRRLHSPERVIVEVGRRPPTPTPAPVAIAPTPSLPTIVVDPGHGGSDTGAVGPGGLAEKTVALAVARRLARILRNHGYIVRLTRDGDESRALTDRTALANRLGAVAFISLHVNASTVASVRGAETYYMSLHDATDAHAAETARKENAAGAPAGRGSTLDLILWDMAQARVLNESARLATDVERQLNGLLHLPDRGVKQAPFVVLTGATMPAVLVEMGFLSNPAEARRLADPAYRQRLAEALARGIETFLRSGS